MRSLVITRRCSNRHNASQPHTLTFCKSIKMCNTAYSPNTRQRISNLSKWRMFSTHQSLIYTQFVRLNIIIQGCHNLKRLRTTDLKEHSLTQPGINRAKYTQQLTPFLHKLNINQSTSSQCGSFAGYIFESINQRMEEGSVCSIAEDPEKAVRYRGQWLRSTALTRQRRGASFSTCLINLSHTRSGC